MLVIFFVLLALSAFFSSSETAYSSANRIRIQSLSEAGNKKADRTLKILDSFDEALSTILIGNNLVNIAAATISGQLAVQIFGPSIGVFVSTFGVTLLVLIFGEIMPKSLAKEYAETFSMRISGIILFLMKILYPANLGFIYLRRGVTRIVGSKNDEPSVTEEELKMLVDRSEVEGVIDEHEKDLVQRSFDFNDISVVEISRPRKNIVAVNETDDAEFVKDVFMRERYSRIPVYRESIDHIVGVLHERDFYRAYLQGQTDITELMRPPVFVVETMKISRLMPKLQREKTHMAVVIDEYGDTSAIVTLEDIIEELVGEIYDEHDEAIRFYKKTPDGSYQIHADFPLDETMELLELTEPESVHQSLGGWLSEQFERVPETGEIVTYEQYQFEITHSDERRVHSVLVTPLPPEEIENQEA
ncbi:hemolysin family protein [Alkalicoccus urumqiensis]|nr:hemolysin family protein [Alkalicoccus urumqiensis]